MHGALNHLPLTDRLWLKRLTGEGEQPPDPTRGQAHTILSICTGEEPPRLICC